MKVNLYFGLLVDVIEFKPFFSNDLDKYKEEFEKWYMENFCEKKELLHFGPIYTLRKDIQHRCLNAEMIIEWMNEVYPESNAKVIAKELKLGEEDTSLPYMCF